MVEAGVTERAPPDQVGNNSLSVPGTLDVPGVAGSFCFSVPVMARLPWPSCCSSAGRICVPGLLGVVVCAKAALRNTREKSTLELSSTKPDDP